MKRQLPKNVRQIGNVSDSPKLYVEDYVDTFFNQLCEKAEQSPKGAFLVGEVVREGEEEYIYIYGALHMKQLSFRGKEITLGENTWKWACEQCKHYFGDAGIVGWCLVAGGQALEVNHTITKVHQKYFPKDKSVFVIKDAETKEEKYYLRKFHDLLECSGHYIYYEKNTEMQTYMIDSRKKNGVTPSEVVEDRAAANFRNVIKEKMEQKEERRHSGLRYAVGMLLLLLVFGAGVTIMSKREQIHSVQDAVSVISELISKETKEPIQTEESNVDGSKKEEVKLDASKTNDVLSNDSKADDSKAGESKTDEPKTDEPKTDESKVDESKTDDSKENESAKETNTTAENSYIVRKGDTLASISREKYGSTSYVERICKLNGLEDGNLIFVGQKLLLPLE